MKQQKKNWPAESYMTSLKTLSHTLLHLDIQPTKMSPLVVKHPFTDSGLAGIYAEDGSLSVGNLLDSPDALRTWRENFSRRINEAETAMNLFCMITKPYQFGYLRLAAAHLSEQDMASFLSYAWISTESPNNDPNLSQRELLSMFRSLDPQKLMDQEEYTQFQNLDDVVTVYRGVTSYNANNIKALSWTLNREVAEWFVHRYHKLKFGQETVLRPALSQLQELRERELRSNRKISDIDNEIARISEQNLVLVRLKSKGYVDSALYLSQMDEIDHKLRELRKLRRRLLEAAGEDRQIHDTERMMEYLEDGPEWLDEVPSDLFGELLDRIIIISPERLKFRLLNGMELSENIERMVR